MALFGRRRSEPAPPDETFPFLTVMQAQRLRELARDAFAATGREVTVYADHVRDDSGGQFGLSNLAASCFNDERGESAWPQLVRDHVAVVVQMSDAPKPFETMSAAELLAATYARLVAPGDLPPFITYAREVAPGLAEVLNLDMPQTVAYFNDEQVEQFGPLADLRQAGLRNLRGVIAEPDVEQHVLEHGGASFEVRLGESIFTASTLLVFADVLASIGRAVRPDCGAIVAVPNRNQLAFHVVADSTAVGAINNLVGFAGIGYDEGVGPLSPDLYWWRPDRPLERITERTDDAVNVHIGAELGEVLTSLG